MFGAISFSYASIKNLKMKEFLAKLMFGLSEINAILWSIVSVCIAAFIELAFLHVSVGCKAEVSWRKTVMLISIECDAL